MNNIKFEIINDILCRMVEPEPLTPDSKLPCVVRLIQDDSRMGMYNRDTKSNRLSDIYLVAKIVSNSIVVDEFMESDYHRFEIIGYPVAEGSVEWALYQMMQGKKVVSSNGTVYLQDKYDNDLIKYKDGYGNTWVQTPYLFLKLAEPSCWQIYEPEPEYNVGDWVEFIDAGGHKSQGKYLSNAYDNTILVLDITYNMRCVVPMTKITRKLSPSEVIIRIGCLSGTVRGYSDTHIRLTHKGGGFSTIRITALDAPTRELVESLLKAQEEK